MTLTIPAANTGEFEDVVNVDDLFDGDEITYELDTSASTSGAITITVAGTTLETITFKKYMISTPNVSIPHSGVYYFAAGGVADFIGLTAVETTVREAYTWDKTRIYINVNTIDAASQIFSLVEGGAGNQFISIPALTTGEFEDAVASDVLSAGDEIAYYFAAGVDGGDEEIVVTVIQSRLTHASSQDAIRSLGVAQTQNTVWYYSIAGRAEPKTTEADAQCMLRGFQGAISAVNLMINVRVNQNTLATTIVDRVNGADGNLAISVPALTAGIFEDISNVTVLNDGDEYCFEVTVPEFGWTIAFYVIKVQFDNVTAKTTTSTTSTSTSTTSTSTSSSTSTSTTTTAPPYTQLCDGFEDETFDAWDGTTTTAGETVTIVNTDPYKGSWHMRCASDGSSTSEYAYAYRNDILDDAWVRARIKLVSTNAAQAFDRILFIVLRNTSAPQDIARAGFYLLDGTWYWILQCYDGIFIQTELQGSMTTGIYYNVELHWNRDAVTGHAELWIDGVKTCEITGVDTTNWGPCDQIRVGMAPAYSVGASVVYVDEVCIDDEQNGMVTTTSTTSTSTSTTSTSTSSSTSTTTSTTSTSTTSTSTSSTPPPHLTLGGIYVRYVNIYNLSNRNAIIGGFFETAEDRDLFAELCALSNAASFNYLIGKKVAPNDQSVGKQLIVYCEFEEDQMYDGYYLITRWSYDPEAGWPNYYPWVIDAIYLGSGADLYEGYDIENIQDISNDWES